MPEDTIVLKFGSSALRTTADLPAAVHEIYRWYRAGWRVVAVVSAIGDATERLLSEARAIASANEPEPFATAELLATGERHSAALLGIALDRAGVPARVIDPREIQLTATGTVLDSEPLFVDRHRVCALLSETRVIIAPGFFAYDASGRLHLFGRGGSDLSAVYLSASMHARRCRLIKDVDGVYEFDPVLTDARQARRFASLGYTTALQVAAPLVQPKAVRYLQHIGGRAEIAGVNLPYETVIGHDEASFAPVHRQAPTSVLLLGLGTVGLGVYQRLCAMPKEFQVVGALVRDPSKYAAHGVTRQLLHTRESDLRRLQPDVVVDALPGLEPSMRLARYFLERGTSIVSANKTVIAAVGPSLCSFAHGTTGRMLYSAAVGGSAPMIEILRNEVREGEIRSIAGVLNGTCNFVLDRCAAGAALEESVREAQASGFAETDPVEDLSGRDAERKLRILARIAFGQEIDGIAVEPLNARALERARHSHQQLGGTLRMVAMAWKDNGRLVGQVRLDAVPTDNPLSQARAEWNALQIIRADSKVTIVLGRGAGRWPTTEAVIADLFELRRANARSAPAEPG